VVDVVIILSFGLLEDMLHVGKVKVAASRPTEDVENITARRFKVACGIVASRDIDLSVTSTAHHNFQTPLRTSCTNDSYIRELTNL